MSNHRQKVELHARDPRCHWCKRITKLICEKVIKGHADPLMATIDHIVSRYHPHRWVKKKANQKRKVLACYECNHRRSVQETLSLSRADILRRSRGFSLSPKGKPIVQKPVATAREILVKIAKLKANSNYGQLTHDPKGSVLAREEPLTIG